MLIDTHCHIHESDYSLPLDDVLQRAHSSGVNKMICVGTSEESSQRAVEFSQQHDELYAAVGVHPHDTEDGYASICELAQQGIVAIGEIGLDYFYTHSPREVQIAALESQIQTAIDNNVPIIFHVREAFDDFWPIFDNFRGLRGVLHSFTDTQENADKAFSRGLFIGVNGISTFTKDADQQKMYATIPLEKMLLETDAPFLTPAPYRGTINEPAYVSEVAKHHASIRGISMDEVAAITTTNATALFNL
ncbi:TatD family hydrolase [Candidatus Saccharibacteria bacterium]|nr:TatD family hydrolase [Candidatus Saccharibacteria bacterium]